MQNLLQDLVKLLERDDRLITEGHLLKNKVVELALSLDSSLIRLLFSSEGIRRHFFQDVDGVLIFDKIKFQQFVSNKAFLPDSYTSFKNKIGLTAEGSYLTDSKEVVLAWPYKDCVLEGGQTKEDAKRNEIFWNETLAPDQIDRLLAPKVMTSFKRYDKDGEHKITSISQADNLIIKGNNLLALHTLKKAYAGQVKLIYIDPPYNTGSDSFKYNDSFNHSSWLTFMRNRLEIAKSLLSNAGIIAISIDHLEAFYLKVLCDEIFGRQNFLSSVTVQNNPKGRMLDKNFSTSHEYLLFYSKGKLPVELSIKKTATELKKDYQEEDEDGFFRALELRNTHREFGKHNRQKLFFPLYIDEEDASVSLEKTEAHTIKVLPLWEDGFEGCWTWGKTKCELEAALLVGRKVKGSWKVYRKSYSTNDDGEAVSKKLKTIWFSKDFHTEKGQKTVDALLGKGVFRAPKPVQYLKTIVDLVTDTYNNEIILDFFAGSGTTGQAVIELNKEDEGNRQFILCEQLDYVEGTTAKRVAKIAAENDSSFIYCELAKANQTFIVEGVVRAKRRAYIPVGLSRGEVGQVIRQLGYPYDLIAKLLYGCGLRLFECLKLRVQDLNFDMKIITVHDGKGQKDRTLPMPDTLLTALHNQVANVVQQHQQDLVAGYARHFFTQCLGR
jgi:adenine-specific DNA-methyltransferase